VNGAQRSLGSGGVAAIDAVLRAAVAHEVLRRRQHAAVLRRRASLQAPDGRGAEQHRELRRLAVALVGATPAFVLRHGDARREVPQHAGRGHLQRRDPGGILDQPRIARAAETDVVREDDGAFHVVVTVHRVDAVDQRNREPCGERAFLKPGHHRRPCARRHIG
jgi:hypothetical protein